MAITIQLFFAHPGFVFTMVYHNLFYTRVWNILRYTINFAIIFWDKCIILGKYNIGKCNIGRMQYWANTILANAILGEYNIGRMRFAPTIIRPISVGAYRIRPIAYALSHTPKITLLHYYNITCNVFWVGSLVWLSHQNINSLPNNYPLKKSPCPTENLGHGGFDV